MVPVNPSRVIWLVVAVVVGVGAFAVGRWTAPKPVAAVDVRATGAAKTDATVATAKVETRVVYRTIVREPNGRTTTTEKESNQAETKTDTHVVTNTVTVTQTVVKPVPIPAPRWSVTGMVGGTAALTDLLRPQLVVGAQVQYRLVGPLVVGVWATTTPTLQPVLAVGVSGGFVW